MVMKKKLNLGSAGEPRKGYLNLDKNACAPNFNLINTCEQSLLRIFPTITVEAELIK